MTKISIGIPFHDDERFSKQAIKSVLNQSLQEWKLILVDGGSSDNSLAIAHRFEEDSRIQIISDGENRKLPTRLNEIAKSCNTEYLAIIDADDIMHPKQLKRQLQLLKNYPEINVLGTNVFSIDEDNHMEGIRIKVRFNNYRLEDCPTFIHPSIIAKTQWFLDNPYDVKMIKAQDYELYSPKFRPEVKFIKCITLTQWI